MKPDKWSGLHTVRVKLSFTPEDYAFLRKCVDRRNAERYPADAPPTTLDSVISAFFQAGLREMRSIGFDQPTSPEVLADYRRIYDRLTEAAEEKAVCCTPDAPCGPMEPPVGNLGEQA